MNSQRWSTYRDCTFLAAAIALTGAAGNQTMPPLSQYLMSPKAEIALAQSAAPASISGHATIMILTAHGYTVAMKGRNGFTCLVERAFGQPNVPTFRNLNIQDPTCYNAAASRSVLLYTLKRTTLALGGATQAQIDHAMLAAVASKTLPTAAPDSIAYMMSKRQYIDDSAKSWYPHLMFFMPHADAANVGEIWGADRLRSPVVFDPIIVQREPWARFFIPVSHWSDGSPAPPYSGT
jgi:hypothetical protein